MSDFAPSVNDEKAAGVRVTRKPFPAGVAGVRLSLEEIAMRIREGSASPKVMGWAIDQLRACGLDGRSYESARAKMQCLLSAVRDATAYVPDPPYAELIKSAEAMLCLAPGLCVRGGDCDDLVVLLGSVLMSVGIPAVVVKQTFGPSDQEHVLIKAQDDMGRWVPLDPSTSMPAGTSAPATSEFTMDPSSPEFATLAGIPEAEFIGIGALPASARVHLAPRRVGLGQLPPLAINNHVIFLPDAVVWAFLLGGLMGALYEWRSHR